MTTSDLGDLLVLLPHDAAQTAFEAWTWRVPDDWTPIGVTVMGDWLLEDPSGAVHLLETMEASTRRVASSPAELVRLLQESDARDELFLEGLALAFLDGRSLRAGHALGFDVPPILGGATDRSNLRTVDAVSYQLFVGRLHEALSHVPPGARVVGVDVDDAGCVSVRRAP